MRRCEAWVQASKTGNENDWKNVQCKHCSGCALSLVRSDGFIYASLASGACSEPEVDHAVTRKKVSKKEG
jgi:hypothetical protein